MNSFQFRLIIIGLIMVKRIYRTETVQVYLYKNKKPLKIKGLTTVIVLKAGLEPARPLLTTGF